MKKLFLEKRLDFFLTCSADVERGEIIPCFTYSRHGSSYRKKILKPLLHSLGITGKKKRQTGENVLTHKFPGESDRAIIRRSGSSRGYDEEPVRKRSPSASTRSWRVLFDPIPQDRIFLHGPAG